MERRKKTAVSTESVAKSEPERGNLSKVPKPEEATTPGRDATAKKRKANEAAKSEGSASESEVPTKEKRPKTNDKDDSSAESDINIPVIDESLGKGKRARIPNKRYSDIILSPTRSQRPVSQSPAVENGDKIEQELDDEIATFPPIAPTKSRSNTSSPSLKKPRICDPADPKYLKPFELGWKRELVYRAAIDNNPKRGGDIYYYNPAGQKFRTMKEINDSLKNSTDLTIDNFFFLKEPLGINDPAKEIIRDAKLLAKKGAGGKTPQRAGSEGSPKAKAPGKNLGQIKVKLPPSKSRSEKKQKNDEDSMELDSTATTTTKRQQNKKPPAGKSGASNEMGNKPCQPCSIRCQGVIGVVPTLQCRLCLCLYHYECVGLSPHIQIQSYVCKNCDQTGSAPSIVLPPLTPINTLKSGALPLQNESNPLPRLHPFPKIAKDAPSPPKNLESKSLVGSMTSWLPHSSTIQLEQRNKENEPVAAPRPQYVEYLAGRKFLIIPKHNVVSITPNNHRKAAIEGILPEAAVEARKSTPVEEKPETYLQNLCLGYSALLHVFQYLKVQDLLRAGCVCTMWRDIANHPSLWRTVRMKNSQVYSFEGLANTLQKHSTVHLDLRKMLLFPHESKEIWGEFSRAIEKVSSLRRIEFCRCPAVVLEKLGTTNPELESITAVAITGENINLDSFAAVQGLRELRLKSRNGLSLTTGIARLAKLTALTHLSITSIKDLHKEELEVIASLKNLECLEFGDCVDFPENFGGEILSKLTKLEKLRLEKGQGVCHTFAILEALKSMPKLEQLELVNFDIKQGFDVALGQCANIKKLLIIPTYVSQSATTNHMVLGGVLRLKETLSHFIWGVTLELLRVTELFVDQSEDPVKKKDKKNAGNSDSIPVLKPVPVVTYKEGIPPAHDPPQVEIILLANLQKLLLQSLPSTKVKILKVPFHATWRQSFTDTAS